MDTHWEQTTGWARTRYATSEVGRPASIEDLREALFHAQVQSKTVIPRGAGHSYTDAMLNNKGVTLDLSRMRRVLAWDPKQGIIRLEPGVTIDDLWRTAVEDGWWQTVHPSALRATIGGCLAMNVHSKNAWKKGTIGEHVLAFELLLASGKMLTVTPASNPDLFYAAIGGMGMLGVITSVTLQLQPIRSGEVMTRQRSARSLMEMFAVFADEAPEADYLEGWIDGHASGSHLGRGLITRGDFIKEPDPGSLQLERQRLSTNVVGIVPPIFFGRALRPLFNDVSVRIGNSVIYESGILHGRRNARSIPLAQFHFHNNPLYVALETLLPLGGHGFQPCVPAEHAPAVFKELFERSQRAGISPFWCWFKQHRADPFLLSYQVNGFSLDLAYFVTHKNSVRLGRLLEEMRETIISAGGRLYLAKDSSLDAQSYIRSMGVDRINRFLAIKRIYDPKGVFQSDLFRRVFTDSEEVL